MTTASLRKQWSDRGICVNCGSREATHGVRCAYCASRHNEVSVRNNTATMFSAYQVLGGACAECGNNDPMVLQFDHVHNDGGVHRKNTGLRANNLAAWVIKNQEEARDMLQLLCANCHARKHSQFNGLEGAFDFIQGSRRYGRV